MVVPLTKVAIPSKGQIKAPNIMILKDRPVEHDRLGHRINKKPIDSEHLNKRDPDGFREPMCRANS
jgi:hypothetical protein